MAKWGLRLFTITIVGGIAWFGFQTHRAGYFNLPEFDENSYAISFKNGLRAIVVDPDITKPTSKQPDFFRRLSVVDRKRRYRSFAFEVPEWFEDAWAFCEKPTREEREWIEAGMPQEISAIFVGARLDAFCVLEVDGKKIPRGLIYSIPRL